MDQNQDFNDIALSKFLQGFPELGNFIISFRDISNDLQDDSGMKVGVFILRSGSEIFYVPAISKDDNIYPLDSVFVVSSSKFLPLTKKTVSIIVNAGQLTQGKPTKIPSTVPINPDMTQLINPPRTGKYVSASTSRLGDFMAAMPEHLKSFTLTKLAEEKSVYESLHTLFALKDLFRALQVKPNSMAAKISEPNVSVVTGIDPTALTETDISSIIDKGYSVKGSPNQTRIAVSAQNYENTKFTNIYDLDGDSDYEVVFNRGNTREAFIPKAMDIGQVTSRKDKNKIALFTNGDYALSEAIVVQGDKLERKNVLSTIFNYRPPVLPRDVVVGDTFTVLNSDSNTLGIFKAHKVALSHMGVEITAYCESGFKYGTYKLNAFRNFGKASPIVEGNDIYMPYASLVLVLGSNVSADLERSANSASVRNEISMGGLLGDQLNLSFDGVEFTVNGKVVGQEKSAMERLVVAEGIDPEVAMTFIKQAKEGKFTKIYLTKQAGKSFEAGETPQFGEPPPPQGKVGLNGSFIPNVQKSLAISDAQSTEATIISELLQAPDMIELVEEYLPDIEECIDKLGRILFLSRIHIAKLSENNDADAVFSFLSSLKVAYRMLGDNFAKLQELVALKPTVKK